jgi:hypothetical protein
MPPPVYTVLVGNFAVTPGTHNDFGPVPPGHRLVLVDVSGRMVNDGAAEILGLIIQSRDGQDFDAWQCPAFGRARIRWRGRQVFDTGDTIRLYSEGSRGEPGISYGRLTAYDLTIP